MFAFLCVLTWHVGAFLAPYFLFKTVYVRVSFILFIGFVFMCVFLCGCMRL